MSTTRNYSYRWRYTSSCTAYDAAHPGGYPPNVLNRTLTATSTVTYGNNFKDWRQRIANGSDCTTGLTGRRRGHVISRGGDVAHYNSGKIFQRFTGDLAAAENTATIIDPGTATDSTANARAKSAFLKHYITARNDWRGGNFLAEIRETLHALRHPIKSLYDRTWTFAGRIGKLKKVHKRDPFVLRKHLADAWLGYAFGIRPLVSDINDATTAFNNIGSHEGKHDTHRVSGFGRNTLVTKDTIGGQAFGIGGATATSTVFDRFIKTDNTVRYTAAIVATCGTGRQDLQRIGLDVFDIAPALWEATWLSFLVDYFANVGEMFDSWRLWDANVNWCKVTVRNSTTNNITNLHVVPHPTTPFYTFAIGGNPGFYALSQYVTRASTSIPHPDFTFKMPGFPDMRWLNVTALGQQFFGSKYHYKGLGGF